MSFSENNPLGALFFDATTRYADRVAIRTPEADLTYGSLRQRVTHMAVKLRAEGVGCDSLVGLHIPESPTRAATSILALTLLGAQWIVYEPSLVGHKFIKLTHVLYDGVPQRAMRETIMVDDVWPDLQAKLPYIADSEFSGFDSADDAWLIASSSGTTGTSKYMAISEKMFFQRILRYEKPHETDGDLLATDFFGPIVNTGYLRFLYTLYIGGTYVYGPSYDYLRSQNVGLIMGSPAHLAKFLEGVPPPSSPQLHEARIGGAAASPRLLSRLCQYFNVVTVAYGSTESGVVSFKRVEDALRDKSVGHCYADISLEIVDESGRSLAPDKEGLVRIKTSSQVSGYLGDSEATASAFKDGWFYPGDKGYLSLEGELYITGRVQDHLNVSGSKVNAESLDQIMQSADDIADALCFLEPSESGAESLAALIALSPDADKKQAVKNLIYALLAKRVHRGILPGNIYQVSSIPRNANGKAMRREAAPLTVGLKPIAQVAK